MGVLDEQWKNFSDIILASATAVFGTSHCKTQFVPGWNNHVKDLYEECRRSFLNWRSAGSPRDGPISFSMRQTRTRFKYNLKICKANEDKMSAESLEIKL